MISPILPRILMGCLALTSTHVQACGGSPPIEMDAGVHEDADSGIDPSLPPGWLSHAVPEFSTVEALLEYATGETPAQVKFVLTDFTERNHSIHEFLDPEFYTLHDQWYWYRLLNGVTIAGHDSRPVTGQSFETIDEIIATLPPDSDLPLDLKYYGDRLYSPKFYADAFGDDRFFGLGSIVHFDPDPNRVFPEEIWAFELEYQDELNEEQLDLFFSLLTERLPPEVASSLRWLARSGEQKEIGDAFNQSSSPFAGRTLSYSDLVIPGNYEPYTTGITAGRIRILEGKEIEQATLGGQEIVVLSEVPDNLPPVAGIITAVPQTPLAHVNLLAKSRGTPNMHLAGAIEDGEIHDYDYFKKRIVLEVTPEAYRFQELSLEEYQNWLALQATSVLSVEQVDLESAPHTVPVDSCGLDEAESLVGLIGGKGAHFCALNALEGIDRPDLPMALSIRGFVEHISPFRPLLEAVLEADSFQGDGALRYAVLEGADAWLMQQGGAPEALVSLAEWIADEGAESPIAEVLAAGGVRSLVEETPLDDSLLATYDAALKARFASLDESQGLRFRSSSNVEDIEGFNGAGLYTSNTGYLHPTELPLADQKRTIQRAILATWSSYFGFGAFEERRHAGIDHMSGGMAVLVHPRFDDSMELSNGVFTLALLTTPEGPHSILTMNAQTGSQSVTNPEGTTLPEVTRVVSTPGEAPFIERIQASTLTAEGEWVLDDPRLLDMHEKALNLASQWLEHANATRSVNHQETFLVLDFEYRQMDEGWPALQVGEVAPERFIWKQVRTLDRPRELPDNAANLPIPGDLLSHATHIDAVPCTSETLTFTATAVHTIAEESFPFDHASTPFIAEMKITAHADLPLLGLRSDESLTWTHAALVDVTTSDEEELWAFSAGIGTPADTGITQIDIQENGSWTLFVGEEGESLTGEVTGCERLPVFVTPSEYLKGLLAPAGE